MQIDKQVDNTEDDNVLKELSGLEQDSRKVLDQAIITLSSSFIALILGFFKDISSYLQDSISLKILFLVLILSFIVAIAINLYSHAYSAKTFRMMQSVHLGDSRYKDSNFYAMQANIELLNRVHFGSFILAIFCVLMFISYGIFTSNNKHLPNNSESNIQLIFIR